MIRRKYFQERITTGRMTLPVVIVFTIAWWFFHQRGTNDWVLPCVGFAWMGLNAFLLALLNNRFSLIRRHTHFHVVLFFMGVGVLLAPDFSLGEAPLTALLLCNYQLFHSYQRMEPVDEIFTGFLFLGIVSLVFPPILYFIPMLYIGMQLFQSFTLRTFFAGIVALLLPYWFVLAYVFTTNRWELFSEWELQLVPLMEISYEGWSGTHFVVVAFLLLLSLMGAVHCLSNSFADKIRTRFHLSYLVMLQVYTTVFLLLQPQHYEMLLPILASNAALFGGHLFALTRSKGSNILFIVVLLLWVATLLNTLWNF